MAKKKKELSADEAQAKVKRVGTRRSHEFTAEQERELISNAQKGDKKAMQILIKTYDKYLSSFVRRRKNETDLEIEDLKNEAIIGFMQSIKKFNLDFQNKLITFAQFDVNRVLNSAVQQAKPLKISQYGFTKYRKINQMIAEHTKSTGEVPNVAKLSELTGFDKETIESILNIGNIVSIDSHKKEHDDYYDTFDIDPASIIKEISTIDEEYLELYSVISKFNEKDQKILIEYYGLMNKPKRKPKEMREELGMNIYEFQIYLKSLHEKIKFYIGEN